ncbi:MAG: hypothetical protein E7L06_08305 [Schaalia turicensis]|nr:hypothetical protein [Schaalia turicensis]
MTHTDSLILTDRPIPPLLVWRSRDVGDGTRWVWACHICWAVPSAVDSADLPGQWREAFAEGLEHMRTAHGCPSMRASGEPCDDYCEDCGGKRWVGPKMTDQEFIAAVDCHDGLVEAFECGLSHKDLHADESQIYGAIETAHGLYTQLGGWVEEFELLRDEIEEKEDLK